MANIDMNSILRRAEAAMKTPALKQKVEQKIDNIMLNGGVATVNGVRVIVHGTSAAADKFIEVLQDEIRSHSGISASDGGLGQTAIDALTKLEHSRPVKVGRNRYQISVSFTDDLHRDSLYPEKYPEGVHNIAALLNTGYDAGKRASGMWHGEEIKGLQHRDGAHFIDNAIHSYMANYASQYGVIDIDVDDAYK